MTKDPAGEMSASSTEQAVHRDLRNRSRQQLLQRPLGSGRPLRGVRHSSREQACPRRGSPQPEARDPLGWLSPPGSPQLTPAPTTESPGAFKPASSAEVHRAQLSSLTESVPLGVPGTVPGPILIGVTWVTDHF